MHPLTCCGVWSRKECNGKYFQEEGLKVELYVNNNREGRLALLGSRQGREGAKQMW